jgi:FixJ family two-component response regulator
MPVRSIRCDAGRGRGEATGERGGGRGGARRTDLGSGRGGARNAMATRADARDDAGAVGARALAVPPGPRVHLVDEDSSFLVALSRRLGATGLEVSTFTSVESFLAEVSEDMAGCVIADLQLPGVGGPGLQEALAEAGNTLPTIFLTSVGDLASSVRAMRLGAEDILSKSVTNEELLRAVDRAFDRDERERAERERLKALQGRFAGLTPREREVLAHVLGGRLNKEIAQALGIDERSVKRHRAGFMGKLGVGSVTALVNLVHAAKLTGHYMV